MEISKCRKMSGNRNFPLLKFRGYQNLKIEIFHYGDSCSKLPAKQNKRSGFAPGSSAGATGRCFWVGFAATTCESSILWRVQVSPEAMGGRHDVFFAVRGLGCRLVWSARQRERSCGYSYLNMKEREEVRFGFSFLITFPSFLFF